MCGPPRAPGKTKLGPGSWSGHGAMVWCHAGLGCADCDFDFGEVSDLALATNQREILSLPSLHKSPRSERFGRRAALQMACDSRSPAHDLTIWDVSETS